MFWILLIGIIIVSCVLKEEDSSGSSSDKHSSTVTSKTRATKTLNVPYPYSAIKRMEGHHLLILHSSYHSFCFAQGTNML